MSPRRKVRLRRTVAVVGIAFGLALAVLRMTGHFGDPQHVDGGLVAVLLIEAASLLTFPADVRRKTPHDG